MQKIVIKNKNVMITSVNSFYGHKFGGIEKYLNTIYVNNIDKDFVELFDVEVSGNYYKKHNILLEKIEFKNNNVEYLSYKNKSVKLINCNVFYNTMFISKLIKSFILEDCKQFLIDHGIGPLTLLKKRTPVNFISFFFINKKVFFNRKDTSKITLITNTPIEVEAYLKNKKVHRFNNYMYIPILLEEKHEDFNNPFSKREDIVFLGRNTLKAHDQKNIKQLLKINKNLKKTQIKFYTFPKLDDKNFVQSFKSSKEAKDILTKSKYIILISKYEGMAMVLVEALASGTPILVTDNLLAPTWMSDNQKNGKVFNYLNKKEITSWIDSSIENESLWFNYHINIKNTFDEKYSKDIFINKWKEILK